MSDYTYSLTSTSNLMTGGSGEPPARPGVIRNIIISNPQSSAITLKLYDSASTTLTTSVAAYVVTDLVSADAYGKYGYAVGITAGTRDIAGTPSFDGTTTYTPPTAAPTGTGLPDDSAAEAQDYEDTYGVFTLRKYPGVKTVDTTISADASTALVPFFVMIIPAGAVMYTPAIGPWPYTSGIVGKTDNASAISVTITAD